MPVSRTGKCVSASLVTCVFAFGLPLAGAQAAGNAISFNDILSAPAMNTPDAIVAVDLDNNGTVDAVTTVTQGNDAQGIETLFNDGTGQLTPGAFYNVGIDDVHGDDFNQKLRSADFNGDGFADIAISLYSADGGLSILLNNGDGTLAPPAIYPTYKYPAGIAIGDFNADGHPDVVAGNYYDQVTVVINKGDGTFNDGVNTTVASGRNYSVAAGDLNGDGKDDIVVSSTDMTGDVLLSNGDGTTTLGQSFPPQPESAYTFSTQLVDTNNDGLLDIARNDNSYDRTFVALGTGDAAFAPFQIVGESYNAFEALETKDLNGDGIADITLGVYEKSWVTVLAGNGDGTFEEPFNADSEPAHATYGVAQADMNGDGKMDIIAAGVESDEIAVLLNTTDYPVPSITSLSPDHGALAGGNAVQILGSGLSSAYYVSVNGSKVPFKVNSAGKITVTMPAATAAGPVAILVKTGGGQQSFTYTYDPASNPFAVDMRFVNVPANVVVGQKVRWDLEVDFQTRATARPNGTAAVYLRGGYQCTATIVNGSGSCVGTIPALGELKLTSTFTGTGGTAGAEAAANTKTHAATVAISNARVNLVSPSVCRALVTLGGRTTVAGRTVTIAKKTKAGWVPIRKVTSASKKWKAADIPLTSYKTKFRASDGKTTNVPVTVTLKGLQTRGC